MQWRYSKPWSTSRIRKICSSSNNAKSSLAILPNSFVSNQIFALEFVKLSFCLLWAYFLSMISFLLHYLDNFTVLPTVHIKIIDIWISWWHWLKMNIPTLVPKTRRLPRHSLKKFIFVEKSWLFLRMKKVLIIL